MENQDRSHSLMQGPQQGWIVSPLYDLLFLANVAWPLLLLPGLSTRTDTAIDFWQVYYLTLPHRWITLFLVAIDPDRRSNRGYLLASMAILLGVLVAGTYLGSGAFLCLGLIDYIWNGWHFASQHAGVLRIYSRKVGGGNAWMERWGLRGFIFYTIARSSGSLLVDLETNQAIATTVQYVDLAFLAIPITLLGLNLREWRPALTPKIIYMSSILLLYGGYLLASSFRLPGIILCLATAASMFHAVEYLAIVSHYAVRREHVGSNGLMRRMASHWLFCLTLFVVSVGTIGLWASIPSHGLELYWQGLNLWAAFTHYALDGIIWKLRRPETAKALGAI